jgi:ABC-2 type transport system permease protein
MSTTSSPFPPPPVTPNLANAFGGVWRLTFRRFLLPGHWLTLGVGLAVLILLFVGGPRGRSTKDFVEWMVNFYVTFLVPALAFVAAAGAMREEMKASASDYVLTRPVPRSAWVVFKYVAHTVCTQIEFFIAFAVLVGLAILRGVPDLASILPKMLIAQVLLVAVFSALGFLAGVLTTRYVVVGLAYGGIVEAGVGQIPTQLSRLSMTHQVRELLAPLVARTELVSAAPGLLGTTGMIALFCVLALGATAALFTLREISGGGES